MKEDNKNKYLAHRVMIEFAKTSDLLEDIFSRHFARFGLSKVKFTALVQLLYADDAGLALSELSEKLEVSRANVTGLIDRLEKDGLVCRIRDPQDRRSTRAMITTKAKNLMHKIMPVHNYFTFKVLEILDQSEKEAIIELCKKLQSNLYKY